MTFAVASLFLMVGFFTVTPTIASAAENLEKIGAVSDVTLDAAYGVATDEVNNRAVVVSWKGQSLSVIDLSDKKNPVVIGSVTSPDLKTASDVVLDATGKFAYVTVAYTTSSGLVTVDITNPATPTITSVLNHAGMLPIVTAGGIDRDGSVIYVVTEDALLPFEIGTDPRTPSPLAPSVFDTTGPLGGKVGGWDVAVENGYAYITTYSADRFYVVQLLASGATIYSPGNGCIDPGNGCIWSGEFAGSIGVDVQGDYAYVVSHGKSYARDGKGVFTIVDVSNPTTPVVVATLDSTDSEAFDGPYDVSVDGNVAAVTSMNTGSVALIDISNPTSPVVISTYTKGSSGTDVAFYDGMIVTLDRNADDIAILDLVDDSPTNTTVTTGGGTTRGALLARMNNRSNLGRRRFEDGLVCPSFTQYMRLGHVSEDVTRMQDVLTVAGMYTGAPSMNFDNATFGALVAFQAAKNIKVDGVYGPQTHTEASKVCNDFNASLSI